jgi:hypothetical protein
MKVAILIYVNDLLLIGSSHDKIQELKEELSLRFRMKNLESAVCFLEM